MASAAGVLLRGGRTVGPSAPGHGTARGYTVEQASTPGIELGIALQLTNILRDVGEDARRGRLYLPLDAVAARFDQRIPTASWTSGTKL